MKTGLVDKNGTAIRIGDVLESMYGHRYEVVGDRGAYHDDNHAILSQDWHKAVIVGNVQDDPSLSVAIRRVRD